MIRFAGFFSPFRSWLSAVLASVIFVTLSAAATGPERLGTISRKPIVPTVDAATLNEWNRDLFEMDEVWIIKNYHQFFQLLVQSGLDHDLIQKLQKQFQAHIPYEHVPKIMTFYTVEGEIDGIVTLPRDLKEQLPSDSLKHIYTYLLNESLAPPFKEFQSHHQARQFFEMNGLADKVMTKALQRTFEIDGSHMFFFTPDLWPQISNRLKLSLIRDYKGGHKTQVGLRIDLTFTAQDDIAGIADKYAGDRDPRALERYLRLLLKRSSNGVVNIPLSKLMQPFIRKHINSHTMCSGANCFNAGVNVNAGNNYKQYHIGRETELLDMLVGQYRFVTPKESLKQDDLLLYRDMDGSLIHVSTFIGEDIVFTKNGLTKFNPYVFQTKQQNQEVYFEDGKYTMTALRIPQLGELPMDARNADEFKAEEFFYENKTGSQALGPMKPTGEKPKPRSRAVTISLDNIKPNRCVYIYKSVK